ncbi:hypothetical protein [Sphingomonas sp.]|uniref:hypothetical protein n=1 Tax=Sphingomonas sp. TaxID=28214 RepID=UPI002EDAA48F
MRKYGKLLLAGIVVAAAGLGAGAMAFASARSYEIGRTDPRRAAGYRPLFYNFSETYTDGTALGITIGSSKEQAIRAAEAGGFVVNPAGWGDARPGGAALYEPGELHRTMLRQDHLSFRDRRELWSGMILEFRNGRVRSVNVYYINFESV